MVDGVFMRLGEIGDDFTVTPTRFVAEDVTVVATGTYSWKHRSTGKPAEVQMAHVWTFRDGKVISMHQHVDTLKVQECPNERTSSQWLEMKTARSQSLSPKGWYQASTKETSSGPNNGEARNC